MKNRVLGSFWLVSAALASAVVACGSSDDTAAPDGGAGTSAVDGGVGTPSMMDAAVASQSDSGATPSDSGIASDSGPTGTPIKTSTCAPAKTALGPEVLASASSAKVDAFNVVAADLNNDGATDLVSLDNVGNGFDTYLSLANGKFAMGVHDSYVNGMGEGLGVGDFTGDGVADIVISAGDMPGLALFAGKGDGTFGQPTETALSMGDGTGYVKIKPADFNADGKLDVMVYYDEGFGPKAAVILNSGKGTFGGAGATLSMVVSSTTSADPEDIAVADLNGDKAAEIIFPDAAKGACVLVNNGSGSFAAPVCVKGTGGQTPQAVYTGDVNGDGKTDIVTMDFDFTDSPPTNVFLGDGKGALGAPTSLVGPSVIVAGLVVDLNNDGKPEILAYDNYQSSYVVSAYTNNGDGTFNPKPVTYAAGTQGIGADEPLVAGDFDGNGLQGFAVAGAGGVDFLAGVCNP